MPIVSIKKHPFPSKTESPYYVSIVGARGSNGSIVTVTLNPEEYPGDTLVDAGRDIKLSRSKKLTYMGYDLSPVFKYIDTVRYVTDGETGDETVTAYRVRLLLGPGLYALAKKGVNPIKTP